MTYTGLLGQKIILRIFLAVAEAIPYGCAAFVFGEMWNSTAGIGFMMTVSAATHQLDRGMAGFITLMTMFAALTTLLRWGAKKAAANKFVAVDC